MDLPRLESDIHDLLNEANVMLLARVPNSAKARGLIGQMQDTADQASAAGAGYEEAEQRLRQAAHALAQKIGASEL